MRRTLLAIGFAVLVSLMFVPHVSYNRHVWRPFYEQYSPRASGRDHVLWGGFILQTVFACILAAMIVNIRWRRTPHVSFDKIKTLFGGRRSESVFLAAFNAFQAATDAYDVALSRIETHSTRANHRYSILDTKRALHKASEEDYGDAAAAYDEVIAACSDPTDHEPYSEADLHAHTIAMNTLSAAFDRLKNVFGTLSNTVDLYPPAAALYKTYCDIHVFATDAYSNAAHCAMISALEAQRQAVKDEFEVMLLEGRAANATAADAAAATTKAAAFKANATKQAAAARRLEQKATEAQSRAKALCADASTAAANAEEALEASQ